MVSLATGGGFTDIVQFSKIAPYLINPLVLIGFCLLLLFGIHGSLLKAKLLKPLSPSQSSSVLRMILRYGFWVAIVTIVLGFVYAGFQIHRDANRDTYQGTITQRAGPCGSNVVGTGNTSSIDCGKEAAKGK